MPTYSPRLIDFISISMSVSMVMVLLFSSGEVHAHQDEKTGTSSKDRWSFEVVPDEPTQKQSEEMTQAVLRHPEVQSQLQDHRYRVLWAGFVNGTNAPIDDFAIEDTFRLRLYDYKLDQVWNFSQTIGSERIQTTSKPETPIPTAEEYDDAVAILRENPFFKTSLENSFLRPYPAMPPTIPQPKTSRGTSHRVIAVGLQPLRLAMRHEIVAVNLSTGQVIRYPEGAPPKTVATTHACGVTNADQGNSPLGTPGRVKVTTQTADGEVLWKFTATRPSASSGAEGSGIELHNVSYKGRRILRHAHIPLLNVDYHSNICGPFRDWLSAENPFVASGLLVAPGVLVATTPPKTIFDSNIDQGNFKGVAIYRDKDELILVSELAASWYRYVSEYRFHEDGTIRPLFRFSAVYNSCVCYSHVHHAYWRFDFDMDADGGNSVDVLDHGAWRLQRMEAKQFRSPSSSSWRIRARDSNWAYQIVPGSNDGTANPYGQGDVWLLRQHSGEIDDSQVRRTTAANLDAFVNSESIADSDIVVWYGGHVTHTQADNGVQHVIGPILRPINIGK